ncbi:hypothetical protein JCM19000A_05490 [Silvimonas sp. JCM 19000]
MQGRISQSALAVARQLDLPEDELAFIFKGHFQPEDQARLANYIAVLEGAA